MNNVHNPPPCPTKTRRAGVMGLPVILADGQHWHLATPRLYFKPEFRPKSEEDPTGVVLIEHWNYPRSVRPKVKTFLDAINSDADSFPLSVVTSVASDLLKLCHDVDDASAADLLDLTAEQVENLAVDLLRVMRSGGEGEVPKEQPIEETEVE